MTASAHAAGSIISPTDRLDDLLAKGTSVIDGGLSTQLERLGCVLEGSLWTGQTLLNDPALIERAHRDFIDAGAQVIITASYQLSRQGFEALGLTAAQADEALRRSVEVARAAVLSAGPAAAQVLVAASVGPYGAILHDGSEYRGRYGLTHEQLVAFHAERIAVLASAGPDLFAVETIPDAEEAAAIAEVLARYPEIPAWVSFTAGTDMTVWAGQSIEEAVAAVSGVASVRAVGVNCVDPSLVAGLVKSIRAVTALPIVVYPNAGGSWDAVSGEWSGAEADPLAAHPSFWQENGVALVGGCCGTDATAIAALSVALNPETV
jgi:homocysteine S-methyltransferase